MATRKQTLMLALAGLTAVGSLAGCRGNRSDKPPVHIIWNMDWQQKFEAQEESPFFEDGRAARPPVEGTVARGQLKVDAHLYQGRGHDGHLVDGLPVQVKLDAALIDRGEERFNIYCAPCHDQRGQGHGPVTVRGGGFKVPPADLHKKELQPAPLGHFYDVITNGKGTMLPYAAQIPVEDRWAIAVWVRTLQVHGRTKGWDKAPTLTAEAAPKPEDAKGGSQ